MASPAAETGLPHQHPCLSDSATDSAVLEAQKWIEAVTGRGFGDKDLRAGLENGILLCELLSSIKPGLVKKINRLPTPVAALDNLSVFLRGCQELGLKGSQLFDPGDLQDTSTRPNIRPADCSRRLKNVLVTVYWLGRAANSCTSYNGPTLDLREFQSLLALMRKEVEDSSSESPKRSIRDSGYIDCWDSERSDSLSPPRHCREDSFDSLDSFGSRSQLTPSPDVPLPRPSSDGRGSDSEPDAPHRKVPDLRKDDMSARRTSVSEPRAVLPFNQYLPNKSNQGAYLPTAPPPPPPPHPRRAERDGGGRKSWSTATSPMGGDRPFRFSHRASVSDDSESVSMIDMRGDDDAFVQPHGQAPPEMVYNQTKEEEDHWQDDLARWKSRRRSVSQDLIKKEEERKMMEQLMTGGGPSAQRRKSIKTYREIVEEKERREDELRDAYRRATTPEQAALVLQRYAQRFTISEAVLERLQLPKLLDRGDGPISLSPRSASLRPHGPIRHLRPEATPAPKFTATVEARVGEFTLSPAPALPASAASSSPLPSSSPSSSSDHRPQIRSRSAEPSSSSGALSPRPYARPQGPQPGKVDSLSGINGETARDDAASRPHGETLSTSPLCVDPAPKATTTGTAPDTPGSTVSPAPPRRAASPSRGSPATARPTEEQGDPGTVELRSPSPSKGSPATARPAEEQGDPGTVELRSPSLEDPGEGSVVPAGSAAPRRPTSLSSDLERGEGQSAVVLKEEEPITGPAVQPTPPPASQQPSKEPLEMCVDTSTPRQNSPAPTLFQSQPTVQNGQPIDTQATESFQERTRRIEGLHSSADLGPAPPRAACETETGKDQSNAPPLTPEALVQARQADRRSWDPEEERKRQERWQQEQERVLQEKYVREQEKLKEEWEKAQREVVEEERRYHEEERRILEETVAPLTPRSPAPTSPTLGDLTPLPDPQDTIVRSLADWERKQELLERQSRGGVEAVECGRSRSSDISTANDSMRTGKSLLSSQSETVSLGQQNGQRLPLVDQPKGQERAQNQSQKPTQNQSQTHSLGKKQQEVVQDRTKPGRTTGDRRCGAVEDSNAQRSPVKPRSPARTASEAQPQSPNRSVSGKKLCSSCGQPLGKGAAMIIETLSLYFHIQCFKCGLCKGQLGDTTTGTDVRIRNGLLNCHQCYIRSRSAGQPTTL